MGRCHEQRTCLLSTWPNWNPAGTGTRIELTTKSGGSIIVCSREHAVVAKAGSLTLTIATPFGMTLVLIYRISLIDTVMPTSDRMVLTKFAEALIGRLRISMAEKSEGSETSTIAAPSPNLAQAPPNSRAQPSLHSSSYFKSVNLP